MLWVMRDDAYERVVCLCCVCFFVFVIVIVVVVVVLFVHALKRKY